MQIDAIRPYRTMAHNNRWANHRLLTACATLSHAEFTAPRTGFFPTLAATLNHILVVDRFYVDAMEGGRLGPAAWSEPEPCKTVAALREAQEEVDRRLIAVVRRWKQAAWNRSSSCTALPASNANGWIECCSTCFSTKSITAAKLTRCWPALRCVRRNLTNSSSHKRRLCAPPSSRSSVGQRRESGAAAIPDGAVLGTVCWARPCNYSNFLR